MVKLEIKEKIKALLSEKGMKAFEIIFFDSDIRNETVGDFIDTLQEVVDEKTIEMQGNLAEYLSVIKNIRHVMFNNTLFMERSNK